MQFYTFKLQPGEWLQRNGISTICLKDEKGKEAKKRISLAVWCSFCVLVLPCDEMSKCEYYNNKCLHYSMSKSLLLLVHMQTSLPLLLFLPSLCESEFHHVAFIVCTRGPYGREKILGCALSLMKFPPHLPRLNMDTRSDQDKSGIVEGLFFFFLNKKFNRNFYIAWFCCLNANLKKFLEIKIVSH